MWRFMLRNWSQVARKIIQKLSKNRTTIRANPSENAPKMILGGIREVSWRRQTIVIPSGVRRPRLFEFLFSVCSVVWSRLIRSDWPFVLLVFHLMVAGLMGILCCMYFYYLILFLRFVFVDIFFLVRVTLVLISLLFRIYISHNIHVEGLLFSRPWVCRAWLLESSFSDPPVPPGPRYSCYCCFILFFPFSFF